MGQTDKDRRRERMARRLGQAFTDVQATLLSDIIAEAYEDLVKTSDFSELKGVVKELADAQKRTEQRVGELSEAQKRTEQRVGELSEAQKRTEQRLGELSEAQKRTEQRLGELAEAQTRSEARMDSLTLKMEQLADAQKATEKTVAKLVKDTAELQKTVGGISNAIGYGIEDRLFPFMKKFLLLHYGVEAECIERKFIQYPDGGHDEVNIYVEGIKGGEKVYFIGECKSQPGRKHLERFDKVLRRISEYLGTPVKGFVVGYLFSPETEAVLKARYPHIDYFKTYEIERKASE